MSNGTGPACPSNTAQDPQVVSNPPGLPAISDRVTDFTGVRRALLRPLPGEQAIGTWQPAPGDLGLQVLEWWAYLADVLTFYNERFTNESYLRTATQAASVANLVALLGYEPAPGTAATGKLAVVSTASHPAEPLVIPVGMSLSSTASPEVPAQTFEVDPAQTAEAGWRGHLHRAVDRAGHAQPGQQLRRRCQWPAAVRPARRPGQRGEGRRPARSGREHVRGPG